MGLKLLCASCSVRIIQISVMEVCLKFLAFRGVVVGALCAKAYGMI